MMEPSTSATPRPNELNTKEAVRQASVIQFVNPSWELSPTFDMKLEENSKLAHGLELRINTINSDTSSESSDSDTESTSSSSSSDSSSSSSSSSDTSSNSDNNCCNKQCHSKKKCGEKNSKGR